MINKKKHYFSYILSLHINKIYINKTVMFAEILIAVVYNLNFYLFTKMTHKKLPTKSETLSTVKRC